MNLTIGYITEPRPISLSFVKVKMDKRADDLLSWLKNKLQYDVSNMHPLAGDASFRRYFRVTLNGQRQAVVMDAPPEVEQIGPFVKIAQTFARLGVRAPEILASDSAQGFLLLTDFGDRLYLSQLSEKSADSLYQEAISALLQLQRCDGIDDYTMPSFDHDFILMELARLPEWFLGRQLKMSLSSAEDRLLNDTFGILAENILQQPTVCVHRDYHSRNLLVLDNGEVGVLDFQDAVWGPVSYDLVSLLKDCYIVWPAHRVERWVAFYYDMAVTQGVLPAVGLSQFVQWFHWTGIQRHLKVLGIFSRLNQRDGKPGYLKDMPRVFDYVMEALPHYPQLTEFHSFLQRRVQPVFREVFP